MNEILDDPEFLNNAQIWRGHFVSAEFIRGDEPPCDECDDACCQCCTCTGSRRQPGTYITIRLDSDPPIGPGPVTITRKENP